LFAEEGKVVIDRENFGLKKKVTLGGHFAGTSADSKAFILENLEFIAVGSFNVRKPGVSNSGHVALPNKSDLLDIFYDFILYIKSLCFTSLFFLVCTYVCNQKYFLVLSYYRFKKDVHCKSKNKYTILCV
jgi:hypothetical protein